MHSNTSSEQVIRRLYQITKAYDKGFSHQITELIKLGLERFGLDIGILSFIKDDRYEVQYCVVPDGMELHPGQAFEFQNTYCAITCKADTPVAIEYVGQHDEYANHPAYKAFGLEAYIGVPIRINGTLFGTLNFSSPVPRDRHFLEIDIDALQLMASWIEVELVRHEQEKQLTALNRQLKHQANYDSLTGILNRRGMYKHLHKDLNHLSRQGGRGVLAVLDIDHFKKLNDTYGHLLGDEVLTALAQTIESSIREFEMVARYGGEEFVLWLPDANEQECEIVCRRLMSNIADLSLTETPLTVSIGACCFSLHNPHPKDLDALIDTLIRQADNALYSAKTKGRNRVDICHFDG